MRFKALTNAVVLMLVLGFAALQAQQEREHNCVACHSKLMKRYSEPVELYDKDIHSQVGLLCSDCHGGDPAKERRHDRDNPEEGFIGAPAPTEIPAFCDRCHGDAGYMRTYNPALPVDQLEKYRTSRHGVRLLDQGDPKPAQCVSCHGVHDIRRADDPSSAVYDTKIPATCASCHSDGQYMDGYSINTDQYADYSNSVHGAALLQRDDTGAPACNDCHGNHGAYPPQVESISHVCGMCHVNNEKLVSNSFHSAIFESLMMPGCETCHGNHAVKKPDESMLGRGESSACGACHEQSADDPGFAVALEMKAVLDSLEWTYITAEARVEKAEVQGMETSDLNFALRDVHQVRIKSRTQVHTFDDQAVQEVAMPGIEQAWEIIEGARELLREHERRRWWLGGATLILLAVITALFLKLRDMESGGGKKDEPDM